MSKKSKKPKNKPALKLTKLIIDERSGQQKHCFMTRTAEGYVAFDLASDDAHKPKELRNAARRYGCNAPEQELDHAIGNLDLTDQQGRLPREILVNVTGFHDDKFVTRFRNHPSQPEADTTLLRVRPGLAETAQQSKGTLPAYMAGLAPHLATSTFVVLAILLSLAAALASRAQRRGGAVFLFVGDSSTGKTTILRLTRSVVAEAASEGHLQTANITEIGMTKQLPSYAGAAIAMGDLKSAAGGEPEGVKVLHNVAFTLSGNPRQNAFSEGTEEMGFCLVAAASETGITEQLRRANVARQGGESVRMLEIPIPSASENGIYDQIGGGDSGKQIRKLEKLISKQFGTLLPAWIECLVRLSPNDAEKLISSATKRFRRDYAKGGSAIWKRIAEHFGLLLAAGLLAIDKRILPIEAKAMEQAVARSYQKVVTKVDQVAADELALRLKMLDKLLDKQVFCSEAEARNAWIAATSMGFRKDGIVWVLPEEFIASFSPSEKAVCRTLFDRLKRTSALKREGLSENEFTKPVQLGRRRARAAPFIRHELKALRKRLKRQLVSG